MTEPLPTPQGPSEQLAYQPISGWAIAGFALGSLFTLLVASSAVVAFFQGAPFFFPLGFSDRVAGRTDAIYKLTPPNSGTGQGLGGQENGRNPFP